MTPPGSAADQFVLFIQVNYQGMMIAASDLEQTASLALNALLPADKVPVTEEITMEPIGSARQMSNDTYAWDMKASRVVIPKLNLDQIEQSLLRQPSEVVKDELMKEYLSRNNQSLPATQNGGVGCRFFPFA